MSYTEPTDLLLLEPAHLASHLRAVVENGMLTLAARYDEASASKPPANGGWSAKQVVGHLIDSAGNNIQRAVRLSIDPELRMPGYKQAEWVAVQGYQDRPWAELLSHLVRDDRSLSEGLIVCLPYRQFLAWRDCNHRRAAS